MDSGDTGSKTNENLNNPMKAKTQALLIGAVMFGTAALSYAYAACYVYSWAPQCARPGDCFGQCTPIGCQTATCIQATGFGYEDGEYNLVSSSYGGYPARIPVGLHTCYVDGSVLYNNCTHSYESLPPGCSCSFAVTAWMGGGWRGGCQLSGTLLGSDEIKNISE